jgi:hypothetical protein
MLQQNKTTMKAIKKKKQFILFVILKKNKIKMAGQLTGEGCAKVRITSIINRAKLKMKEQPRLNNKNLRCRIPFVFVFVVVIVVSYRFNFYILLLIIIMILFLLCTILFGACECYYHNFYKLVTA